MGVSNNADSFSDVLGAYALDAVEPDEREEIERHLRDCPRCRAEVAEHRAVAGLLSQAGEPAPDGVWDRIVAELSPPAPPLRMSFSPTGEVDPMVDPPGDDDPSPVTDLRARRRQGTDRRQVAMRTFLAAVAAALLVVAALGAVVVSQNHRLDRSDKLAQARPGIDNSALSVHMKGMAGEGQAVVQKNGRGLFVPDKLRPAASGDVYQLWAKLDNHVLSLGTFGSDSAPVQFQLDPTHLKKVKAFMVTEELAPGVASTNQPPIIAGTI